MGWGELDGPYSILFISLCSSSCLTESAPSFLCPKHDKDLREPLVPRQGSQVSMRVVRGSASWLLETQRGEDDVKMEAEIAGMQP